MRIFVAAAAVLALLFVSNAHAIESGVNLAHIKEWNIIVASDAIPSEKYAAEELQSFLEQATGAHLKITNTAPPKASPHHFYIGVRAAAEKAFPGLKAETFGPEDLRIVIRNGNVAIVGGQPRGTLYGVYTFLEDYVGVRFLTADDTFVPKVGGWRVIGPVDRTYRPPLVLRHSYFRENSISPAFATRLRNNAITDDPKYGGRTGMQTINHSFGRLLPSSKYGKDHPEYYALVNGKRLAPVKDDWHQTQLCLTNPDVLRLVTQAVLDEIDANPNVDSVSVSQNDDDKYCRCPKCAAIDDREGTPMGSLLNFVNAVAAQVAKHYPHVRVGTLSYWYSRKPPKTLKPAPNVLIQLCSIECCPLHAIDDPACAHNRKFCEDADGWAKICQNLSIWNYNVNFHNYQLPMPNLRVIGPNVRYFVAHHAKGVFMQAAGDTVGSAFSDLHNYVISNLLWDPNRSGEALRDEFLRLHYGPAAEPLRQLVEEFEQKALSTGHNPSCFAPPNLYGFDDELLARDALVAFSRAIQLAPNDMMRDRVEKASLCGYRLAIEPCWDLSPGAKIDPVLQERMKPLVKKFFSLCSKYHVTYVREGEGVDKAKQRLKVLLWGKQSDDF
ncbi:MAG TPA: DUF4838 domain-containing protein [Lacipirellulaceae bacterium]|nr:DUF4838 domain-containing protein [Lacipirellulaceae bacterium]